MSCRNCSSRSTSVARSSASSSTVASACWRRRACQTMARNIADISGTSKSSPQGCSPCHASAKIRLPVARPTRTSSRYVEAGRQSLKPNSRVKLTQMRWNGIVSQPGQRTIAATLSPAKPSHAASTDLRRNQAIAGMANGFDRSVRTELLPQSADANVDDVGTGIEVVAPHLREQALAAQDLTGVPDELVQEPELTIGEIRDLRSGPRLRRWARMRAISSSRANGFAT